MSNTLASRCVLPLLVVVSVSAGGCQREPARQAPPPQVSVSQVVERRVAEWDEYTGRLEAVRTVEVRPRVSGAIDRVEFKEGAIVRRGDVLFLIDPRPYQAELDRAVAELQRAIDRSALAKAELERAQKLLTARAMSQEEFDQRTTARAETESAMRAASANVALARLNLEFTRITAPIDGRIGRAIVTAGNLVTGGSPGGANATLLTTIVSIDPIYVYFEADERSFLKYVDMSRTGARPSSRETRNPVQLGLANETGYPHQGYIDFVDNRLDPATGTIRARAVFDNGKGLFTPGLFARVRLVGSAPYEAILVNDRAVGTDQGQKFVLAVSDKGVAEYRVVKLGPVIDGLRVIREGLKPGDTIIVNGLQRVRPGMTVAPQPVAMDTLKPAGGEADAPDSGVPKAGAKPDVKVERRDRGGPA